MTIENPPFKDYIFNKFIEWEKQQPNRRSFVTVFARWLSDNSYEVEIKQQVLDAWIKGTIPKDQKYISVLAEKFGDEIYDVLGIPRPNPYLQRVNRVWEFLPESIQQRIAEEAETYETTNEVHRVKKGNQRRKKSEAK